MTYIFVFSFIIYNNARVLDRFHPEKRGSSLFSLKANSRLIGGLVS